MCILAGWRAGRAAGHSSVLKISAEWQLALPATGKQTNPNNMDTMPLICHLSADTYDTKRTGEHKHTDKALTLQLSETGNTSYLEKLLV
jgi:hypothetical protein